MNANVQPIFTPDVEAMRTHVEHLFGGYLDGCHEGLIELAWTDTQPNAEGRYRLSQARLFGTDQIDDLVTEAMRLNAQPMCNVYIGAALRRPETAPFGRAQDSDAWALTSLYVDLDDPGTATSAKEIYGLDKPTMVVVTGRAPHTRAQMWWRLEEPLTDPAKWPNLVRGMAVKMQGDTTVTNPSRVMRLAGTIAWPVKDGRTVELTSIAQLKEPGRGQYDPEHLAQIFPPVLAATQQAVQTTQQAVTHKTGALGLTDKIDDGRERYMLKTIGACLIELIGTTGACPSAQDLYDAAWPQYERKVDLTRPGRGPEEFAAKCSYTVRRFEEGRIGGVETLDKAIAAYQAKQSRQVSQPHQQPRSQSVPAAPITDRPFPATDLKGSPNAREWVAEGWIPKGVITGLSGDGGMGKTLLAQQLLYAAGVGGKFLGLTIPKMRCLGVFCEDDRDELHRRHDDIKKALGHVVGNPFENVLLWPRVGHDNLLVTFDKDNKPATSPFFDVVMKCVLDDRLELLVLDNVADLFGGNEIIRAQVNYFVKAVCGAFIKEAAAIGIKLTVVMLSHPSQAGRNSGTGESGSTAWNNAVRARLYLTRPEDGLPEQRILTRKKSNYSSSGDDVKIDLLWSEGVLKTVAENTDSSVTIRSIEHQILQLVAQAWEANRPYKVKRGSALFLDAAMVAAFKSRVPTEAVVAALSNLKTNEKIVPERKGDRRGWMVAE